jgi:hypothetical protein
MLEEIRTTPPKMKYNSLGWINAYCEHINPSITACSKHYTFANKRPWVHMSIKTPTIRLMGDLLSLH